MSHEQVRSGADADAPFRARLRARDGMRPQSTLAILAGYEPKEVDAVEMPPRTRPLRPVAAATVIAPAARPALPAGRPDTWTPPVRPREREEIRRAPAAIVPTAPARREEKDERAAGLGRLGDYSQLAFAGLAMLGLAGLSLLAIDNALRGKTSLEPEEGTDTHRRTAADLGPNPGAAAPAAVSAVAVQEAAMPAGIEQQPWFNYSGVADYLKARVEAHQAAERAAARLQEQEAERLAATAIADAEADRLALAARAEADAVASRTAVIEAERLRLAREEAERIANEEAARLAAQAAADAAARAEAERLAALEAERAAAALAEQNRLAQLDAQRVAEAEAARLAELETRRLAAEAEALRLAEIEAQRAAAAAEQQRLADLAAQKAAEEEAARLAALEAARAAEVAEARRLADIEAKRLADLEAQRLRADAEAEQMRLADIAAKRAAEEEAARLAALEAERAAQLAQAVEAERLAAAALAARKAEEDTITLAAAVIAPPAPPVIKPEVSPGAASLKPVKPVVAPDVQQLITPDAAPVARRGPTILTVRAPEVRPFVVGRPDAERGVDVFLGERVALTSGTTISAADMSVLQQKFLDLVGISPNGAVHTLATPDGREIVVTFESAEMVETTQASLRTVGYQALSDTPVSRAYADQPVVNVSVMCRDVAYALPGQERGRFSACQDAGGNWMLARPDSSGTGSPV